MLGLRGQEPATVLGPWRTFNENLWGKEFRVLVNKETSWPLGQCLRAPGSWGAGRWCPGQTGGQGQTPGAQGPAGSSVAPVPSPRFLVPCGAQNVCGTKSRCLFQTNTSSSVGTSISSGAAPSEASATCPGASRTAGPRCPAQKLLCFSHVVEVSRHSP